MLRYGLPLLISTCALLGAFLTWHVGQRDRDAADRRLAAVEHLASARELAAAQEEQRLLGELERLELALDHAIREELSGRIGLTEASVRELREELRVGDELAQRLDQLGARFEQRLEALDLTAREARDLADVGNEALARLSGDLDRLRERTDDPIELWRELMGPVVQITGGTSVGSGVLLQPTELPAGEGWRTLLLTAWHVVRDVEPGGLDARVPVRIYEEDGGTRRREARILCHDADLDVALLELEGDDPLPYGALLAPPQRVAKARVFEPIWAVGCPLGTDPIPTSGEIASPDHEVDGDHYWMINAATYIGNSGGGIFDASSFELLGVFSKIYNHGSSRPTIVPHMGLVTPLDEVYPWLERNGWRRNEAGQLVEIEPELARAVR